MSKELILLSFIVLLTGCASKSSLVAQVDAGLDDTYRDDCIQVFDKQDTGEMVFATRACFLEPRMLQNWKDELDIFFSARLDKVTGETVYTLHAIVLENVATRTENAIVEVAGSTFSEPVYKVNSERVSTLRNTDLYRRYRDSRYRDRTVDYNPPNERTNTRAYAMPISIEMESELISLRKKGEDLKITFTLPQKYPTYERSHNMPVSEFLTLYRLVENYELPAETSD